MSGPWQAHPWHGVPIGDEAPAVVTAYVEIVPADTVKYEIDKATGHLQVDRPQRFSNVCPSLYGFLPQTWCGERVAALCRAAAGREVIGDGDPLDVCVLSDRHFTHGDFLVRAVPIGGLRMIDHDEADDKVIAVLRDDTGFGRVADVGELPAALLERLRHYFLTYKLVPGAAAGPVTLAEVYGRDAAHAVIEASRADYRERFAGGAGATQ
jgi:inorganic pyrophosphatase